MVQPSEKQAFAARLRQLLDAAGVRPSPTVIANEFNLRYWGRGITAHTARNWLLGNALPTQEKLRVLAQWLQVSPQELRYGAAPGGLKVAESTELGAFLDMADQEMIRRYVGLQPGDRKVIRDVVQAFAVASQQGKAPA